MMDLISEMGVAASLGGVCSLVHPAIRLLVTRSAFRVVDADLAAAVQEQDKTLSTVERLQLRALRVYLRATVQRQEREDVKIIREKYNLDGGFGYTNDL
ncbi:hypothetical protein E2562_030749 [Oryza meyeriana var. granulata]|uniref:Uncharacterized protein n=1 Tax=Oryza meyeriana var. granulata TaxID=110450 RepID=A0A6G1E3G7_9ORYZ|nr:hypothetical protein E2562_030749 [Oryza meyeriana var. granulata]